MTRLGLDRFPGALAAWLLTTACLWFGANQAVGAVIYVSQAAGGAVTNGQSWTTAFRSVQSALSAACPGDELWVAAGTYYESIGLPPGVALYGGFAGAETNRTQRHWTRNSSILDGSPLWRGWPMPPDDPESLVWRSPRRAVAILPGADSQTRLDGFTIRHGWYTSGAGVYIADGSPVVANNTIVSNTASGRVGGGGLLLDVTRTLPEQDALDFFTNTADRLLRLQFPFGLTNISVYPTNYYTPTVHRVLQLAANLHDATTEDYAPSVFRPIFHTNTMNNVFIGGYTNDNNALTVNAHPANETYGIPFVVGAKKGIPNFNEFFSQIYVQAARKLEVVRQPRQTTNDRITLTRTNEMFLLSISNLFALESWNSYTQAFRTDWQIQVRSDLTFLLVTNGNLTNPIYRLSTNLSVVLTDSPGNRFYGFNPKTLAGGFVLPLYTNMTVLTNGVYRAKPAPPHFELVGTNRFETNVDYVNLQWGLVISNRLTYVLSSLSDGRILDYVHLRHLDSYIDITGQLLGLSGLPGENPSVASCWRTNRVGGRANGPTEGVLTQIGISLGSTPLGLTEWANYALNPLSIDDTKKGIDRFRVFFGLPPLYDTNVHDNLLDVMQAPFAPARKMVVRNSWQANDPLVHHMVEHLKDTTNNTEIAYIRPRADFLGGMNLTNLNTRYKPWRGNPLRDFSSGADLNAINPAVKDPGITKSDDWDFPATRQVNLDWLDRVHRGTPWQTIYLGVYAANSMEWARQFPDFNPGLPSHPTNDWRLLESYLANDFLVGATNVPAPVVANNTIVANQAASQGGGVYLIANTLPLLANNIIVENSSGIGFQGGVPPPQWNNCVSGNASYDYAGLAAASDISQPPLFDRASGNFQLLPFSPCIDAGAGFLSSWVERAGAEAIQGAHIDIGAHEFNTGGKLFFSAVQWRGPNAGATGEFQLTIKGLDGRRAGVEASSNLVDWVPLGASAAGLEEFLLRDAPATNVTVRFYRAVEIP